MAWQAKLPTQVRPVPYNPDAVPPKQYPDFDFEILPNREAIASFDGKVLLDSFGYLDVQAYEHAVAFTVAKMMDADLLAETKAALSDALKNGTDFREFKRRLKPYLMSKGWWGEQVMGDPKDGVIKKVQLGSTRRLRTVYHTNLQTAYAAGQWQRIQQTKDAFPFLQYMPSVAGEPRQSHKKYYNLVLPVDHPLWQVIFPPNEWGCLCWVKQLTRAQAEAIGITDDTTIEYETVQNKRTGETVRVPKGIHPSFAHNHDRLTAIMRLAKEKHGSAFVAKLGHELDDMMLDVVAQYSQMAVIDFAGLSPRQAEIDRLKQDGNSKPRVAEGVVAELWQQKNNAKLERFDAQKHSYLMDDKPPDFAIADPATKPKSWRTVDVMFALAADADVDMFLRSFNKSDIAWEKRKQALQTHLKKAHIVPMDLTHFDTQTRTKLLAFMLSLPEELQRKIELITHY